MKRVYAVQACVLGAMLCAATLANADTWNKKTYVTTSQSIEVPGAVLPPGKYVFKLLDSASNRHIVQILNSEENHVYTTNLAIPKQRMEPADKTVLTFYEMPGGGPEPIRAWFYPGDTIGQEFAYPKSRAMEISQALRQHVPVLAEARTPEPAKVITETPATTPTPEPVANENLSTADTSAYRTVVPEEVTPAVTPEPAAVPTPEATASMPDEQTPSPATTDTTPAEPAMPHTAGNMAALGLLGLSCLGIAGTMRKVGSKS